jgi:N-acetylneuraminic acid mutarotase
MPPAGEPVYTTTWRLDWHSVIDTGADYGEGAASALRAVLIREEKMNALRPGPALVSGLMLAAAAAALGQAAWGQAPPPPLPQPSAAHPWVQGAPFPEPSEEVLGATAGGKLYVFAGLAPGWKPKAMVLEYDPASNTWSKKRPMRLASHHVAFTSLNNKIYAFGGFAFPGSGPPGWNPVDNVWEYDPAADEWKELAPMPTRRGAAAAGVVNGKIYVTGGANSLAGLTENGIHPARPHNVVGTVEEYDPAANSWKTVRPLLLARNHHVAAGVGDKLYVIGGRVGGAFISSASNNVDLVEMYDPAADLWSPRTRMPTARSAIAGGVYNGHIIVAGGEGQDQRFLAAFKAVEAYDTALNRWDVLPSMPHQRHGLAGGIIDHRFYAVSGDAQSAGSGIEHSAVPFNEILQLDLVLK